MLRRIYRKHYSENSLFKAVCEKVGPVREKKMPKKIFQNES